MKIKYYLFALLMYAAAAQANETEWLNAINQVRIQGRHCGQTYYPPAKSLTLHNLLSRAAQGHADKMAKHLFFSHQGQDGSTPFERIKQMGYTYRMASENIAAGEDHFTATLSRWLTSEGHCTNIMDADATETGIAYAYSPSGRYHHYWVQVFATPR